ncbi:MAG: ParA family protein [Gammaproteobacteria bacterium]
MRNRQEGEGLDGTIKESDAAFFGDLFREACKQAKFDYVLIDMPGNVYRRDTMVIGGLVMSDVVLVPIEPTNIALWGLQTTFALIEQANDLRKTNRRRAALAMVWNKADRRTKGGKEMMKIIEAEANARNLPPIFKQHLSIAPPLTITTNPTHAFTTVKAKLGTAAYYENVRHVTNELVGLCEGEDTGPSRTWINRLSRVIRRVLEVHAR